MDVKKIFLLGILLLCELAFGQWDVEWVETSFSDFADGEWDLSLYVSHRANLEGDSGAVEWTPRYDLDLNGYPDLVSSDYAEGVRRIRVWYMGPSGLDSSRYLQFYDAGGANDIADLNCDGYPELIQSGFGYDFVLIFWNNEGRFDDYDTTMLGPHNDGEGIYVADYDKDGYLDIALTDEGGFRIYWGGGGGEHGWRCVDDTIFLLRGTHYNIEAADLDGNGYLDLLAVYGRSPNGPLYIFRNYGGRVFVVDSIMLSDAGYGGRKHGLSVGDIDRDGDIDVIATSFYSSSAVVADILLNDGSGDFTDDIVINPGACHGGCDILDFDGDGWLDILFFRGSPGGYLKVYLNTTLYPWFDDGTTVSIGPFPVDASGGIVEDINCDGYFDIFVDNMGDNSYVFWGPSFSDYENFPVRQDHHGMFRDPGNIATKEPSAYYISNVFDVGGTVCRGEVNWVAYDSLAYDGSGYLPYPAGSYIVILGRSGDSPTIDATWTDWDTLRNGEELPSSLVLKRYFQYKILFNYRNTAYLPWLESIEFSFDTCEIDTNSIIDSIWFSEETDCNDSNIVEICYIVNSSSYVQIQVSSDSGETWLDFGTDWFSTFFDTAGDIGYVDSGLHCFYWIMSADYPGVESDDWGVRIIATGEVVESFDGEIDTSLFVINGNDGFIDPDSGYLVLTSSTSWRNGRMFTHDSVYIDSLAVSFDFKIVPGYCYSSDDSTGADGLSLVFSNIQNPPLAAGGLLGLMFFDGWGVALDIFRNACCDVDGNHIEISTTDTCCMEGIHPLPDPIESAPVPFEMVDGEWHHIDILVDLPHIVVALDGVNYIDDNFPSITPFWGYIGFSGATAGCYAEHIIDNVRIVITSEMSQFYSSLDSREPDVNIICPDSGVMPGNTIELHWSASDMFLENENTCSLIVSYCSMYEDTLELSDTVFDVAVDSSPLCDTVCFEIFVRDSFCNYGYNRCCTPILNPHLALRLLTPPSDSIIACDDQEIIFKVQYNSDCLPLDSANTYLIIDSTDTFTLDSTQLNFDLTDSTLNFSPGPGYWHSGYHFFQIHIQDNCGNAIDSLFSALFDTEPPTAYIVEPSTNDTFSDFPLLMSGNIQRIVISVSDDISGIRPDSIIFVVSEDTIPFHHMKY